MDTSRNHLVTEAELSRMDPERRSKYAPVPEPLQEEAGRLLAGRDEVTVPRSSTSPVGKWSAEQRRTRRRMQKQSRRRNRA